jgi:hypothetical protein
MKVQVRDKKGMGDNREQEKERKKLTTRHLPNTTFGHTELNVLNINRHLAFMHKKHHLHLARVFHALEAVWWNFNHA